MKTKQQVIEEAYGEHWEKVKRHVGADGWTIVLACDIEGEIAFAHFPRRKEYRVVWPSQVSYQKVGTNFKWRPVSLRGLEDNNGWHVINGPEDLPKVKGFYIVWWNSGRSDPKGRMWFDPDSNHWVENWLDWFSHWQPEMQPPLYGPDQKGDEG